MPARDVHHFMAPVECLVGSFGDGLASGDDCVSVRFGESTFLELETCGSTNKEAMRLAISGEAGPIWVSAFRQEEGRGRSGRLWESLPGNLMASLFVRLPGPIPHVGQLSLVAGVAMADAIFSAAQDKDISLDAHDFWLKWPNDIMFGAAKCGGILVETSSSVRGGDILAVLGVGLNLDHGPNLEGRATTCLRDLGFELRARDMLGYVDRAMIFRLTQWDGGLGFGEIRTAWLARAGELGRAITVHDGSTVVKGMFAGVGDEGYLLVRQQKGDVIEVAWGDVMDI